MRDEPRPEMVVIVVASSDDPSPSYADVLAVSGLFAVVVALFALVRKRRRELRDAFATDEVESAGSAGPYRTASAPAADVASELPEREASLAERLRRALARQRDARALLRASSSRDDHGPPPPPALAAFDLASPFAHAPAPPFEPASHVPALDLPSHAPTIDVPPAFDAASCTPTFDAASCTPTFDAASCAPSFDAASCTASFSSDF